MTKTWENMRNVETKALSKNLQSCNNAIMAANIMKDYKYNPQCDGERKLRFPGI